MKGFTKIMLFWMILLLFATFVKNEVNPKGNKKAPISYGQEVGKL